ncbi:MAG: RluA family pseudouridine synthase [Planctomycetota bacterium]
MNQRGKEAFERIHVSDEDDGQVLERVLKKRFVDWSWGDVRRSIRGRRIQINGNLCVDCLRKVSPRDVIKFWGEPLPKPVGIEDLRIVFADEFLVVVEKPAGITSVRHFEERNLSDKRRQLQPTLEELLPQALERHFHPAGAKRSPKHRDARETRSDRERQQAARIKRYQVVAVHRLDRDTSGLMIFARTPSVAQALGKAFRSHRIVRKYHAVVRGHPEAQTLDTVLVRDRGDGLRGTKPADRGEDPTQQRAITRIRPIERLGDYAMVECELETGRTHQIRIHLSEAGYPLCGDALYGGSRVRGEARDGSGAPRQALHSATLAFEHPITGAAMDFKMPWPADLHRWLQSLRGEAAKKKS